MRASLRELNTPTSTALAMMMIPSFRLVASVISALCPLLIGVKTALGELPKSVAAGPESIADSQGSVFYADPATGIVYRKVVHTTERAVAKTEVDFREEIVYRPQVVIETKPETKLSHESRRVPETISTDIDMSQEILTLSCEGLTASQIVERIWGLKPSRSKSYQDRLDLVKKSLNQS